MKSLRVRLWPAIGIIPFWSDRYGRFCKILIDCIKYSKIKLNIWGLKVLNESHSNVRDDVDQPVYEFRDWLKNIHKIYQMRQAAVGA